MTKRKVIETSQAAYQSLQPEHLAEIYRKILGSLAVLGEATTQEVAAHMRIDHAKVWKRFAELREMNLVYRPGNKRPLKSGRSGYTYMLSDNSLPKTESIEKALKGASIVDYSRKLIPKAKPTQQHLF